MAGKKDRIERINSQAVPLPEAVVDWMDRRMPRYIIYEAGKTDGKCTGCGAVSNYKKLRIGNTYTCPACKKRATAKTKKTMVQEISRKFVYIQKIKNGVMVRFIERVYRFSEEGIERKENSETLRGAVEKGRRQYWYEEQYRWTSKGFTFGWQENKSNWSSRAQNNPMYCNKNHRYERIGEPEVYRRNIKGVIEDSSLKWLTDKGKDLIRVVNNRQRYYVQISGFLDVYEALHRWPCLETLYKTGWDCLVGDIIYNCKIKLGAKEKKPQKILGIPKECLKEAKEAMFRAEDTQTYILKCQMIMKCTKDTELIQTIARKMTTTDIRFYFFEMGMSFKKTCAFLDNLKSQDKYDYVDYLRMARAIGSDMTDEFVLYPRDVKTAHDAVMNVINERERKRKRKEAREKDASIQKVYKRIKKKFSYENDDFVLRPAKTNSELVKEGQTQHICVGSAGYAGKMMRGESYILFLRKKDHPEKPFYTVEITPQYEIIQRHGKYNKEGKEVTAVDTFLEKFRREVGHVEVNHAVGA